MVDIRKKKRLGDMLIEENIITEEQLQDALEKKKPGQKMRLGNARWKCRLFMRVPS